MFALRIINKETNSVLTLKIMNDPLSPQHTILHHEHINSKNILFLRNHSHINAPNSRKNNVQIILIVYYINDYIVTHTHRNLILKTATHYGSLQKFGVFGGSKLCRWQYKTSKQKKHISGCATIPFRTPFGISEVPLHVILVELFSFCFFVPQHPAAIFIPGNNNENATARYEWSFQRWQHHIHKSADRQYREALPTYNVLLPFWTHLRYYDQRIENSCSNYLFVTTNYYGSWFEADK